MSDQIEDLQFTEWQVRLLTMNYARSFSAVVERAADEIAAQTEDPDIRRSALLWKTNAIAASQSALLKDDPVVVMIDMWALTEQMARFLDNEDVPGVFGPLQSTAIEAAQGLETRITELASSVSAQADAPRMRRAVEAWVAEHPIDLSFSRRYPRSVIESMSGGNRLGALAAVESIEESLAIHTQLLPVFLEVLPKQASWRAELVIDDYFSRREIEEAAEDLKAIATNILRLHEEIEELPALLDDQRDAVFIGVRKEVAELTPLIDQQRVAALAEIDSQRLETVAALAEERRIVLIALAEERQIVLDAIAGERQIVLDVIAEERQIVLAAVEEQRIATLAELPDLAIASLKQADPELRSLVDHVFRRAALLGGVMGLLGLLAAAFLVRQLKGGRPAARSAD